MGFVGKTRQLASLCGMKEEQGGRWAGRAASQWGGRKRAWMVGSVKGLRSLLGCGIGIVLSEGEAAGVLCRGATWCVA